MGDLSEELEARKQAVAELKQIERHQNQEKRRERKANLASWFSSLRKPTNRQQAVRNNRISLVIIVLFSCVAVYVLNKDSRRSNSYDVDGANRAAISAVKANLKAPSTAGVQVDMEHSTWNEKEHLSFVTGHVDAQNSFGAMIRAQWHVTLRDDGHNNFEPISVIVDD